MNVGTLAAFVLGSGVNPDLFLKSQRLPEPKYQSEEEALVALEKAQDKRNRKAAKRLKNKV